MNLSCVYLDCCVLSRDGHTPIKGNAHRAHEPHQIDQKNVILASFFNSQAHPRPHLTWPKIIFWALIIENRARLINILARKMAFFVTGNIYYQKQLIYHIDTILTQINRKPYSKSCIRNMNKLQMLRRRSSDSASLCLHLLLAMDWYNNPRKALFKQSNLLRRS